MLVRDTVLEFDEISALLAKEQRGSVLTVYLDPETISRHEAPRWLTQLNSGLRNLSQQYPDDKELAKMITTATREIQGLDPVLRQRTLIYVRSLDPDWRWVQGLHGAVGSRVCWGRRAHVLPMLTFFYRRPTLGVIQVSKDGFRPFTWRQGFMTAGESWQTDWDTEHWRRFAGAAYPQPGRMQQTVTHSEHYGRRFLDNVRRNLVELIPKIEKESDAQGWERVMVFGPTWVRDLFLATLSGIFREKSIPVPPRHLPKAGTQELTAAIDETVTEWLDVREEEQLDALIDAKDAGGPAAIGVQEVLDLLNVNRIQRLFVAANLELAGYRRPLDGILRLYEHPTRGKEWDWEPALVEAAIVLAMNHGAEIVPLAGPAAQRLLELGGLGAMLRY